MEKVMKTSLKVLLPEEHVARKLSIQEFHEVMGVAYLPTLRFISEEVRKEVIQERPYFLRFGLAGIWNRKIRNTCLQHILQGYEADLTVRWIGEILGYGLYNNQELQEGEYIGEYTGVVRPLHRTKPDHNAYCLHYPTRFWSQKMFIIDAWRESNCLRFANHSDHATMALECLMDDEGLLHFVLMAKRFLPRGTHLTFDYGKDYWKYREKIHGV